MAKSIVRTTLLTLVICLSAILSKAQIGYDYAKYDLGASVAFNSFYGDTQTPISTKAINFNFSYNQTAFINYIVEAQIGKLAGGDANKDLLGRQFATDYHYFAFRVQVQAGEIIDYSQSPILNAFKNLYVGTGVGTIYNNITSINRYSILMPGYYTPGDDKSQEIFIPARVGYEIKIFNKYSRPDFKIDIGYQYNFILGDDLDGFKAGYHNDSYGQFTIGAKFSIGGVTSYRKQINY
jgi:hypothetical protein